eukprot:376046_1
MTEYAKFKVSELREFLETRGLETSGTKPVLVERLEESDLNMDSDKPVELDVEVEEPATKKQKVEDEPETTEANGSTEAVVEEEPESEEDEVPEILEEEEAKKLLTEMSHGDLLLLSQKLVADNLSSAALIEAYQKSQQNPEKCKVFVRGLPFGLTKEKFMEAYKTFGKVNEVIIIKDRNTQRSKGFGFVQFSKKKYAAKAIETKAVTIEGRETQCSRANPRGEQTSSGGRQQSSYGGGGGYSGGGGYGGG